MTPSPMTPYQGYRRLHRHPTAPRHRPPSEMARFTETFVVTFADAGMPPRALPISSTSLNSAAQGTLATTTSSWCAATSKTSLTSPTPRSPFRREERPAHETSDRPPERVQPRLTLDRHPPHQRLHQYPAFTLFYKFDDQKIYLTHIQLRDELAR